MKPFSRHKILSIVLSFLFLFNSIILDNNLSYADSKKKHLSIEITSDKEEYKVGEHANLSIIFLKRNGRPANIKPYQLKARFPDEPTIVPKYFQTRIGISWCSYEDIPMEARIIQVAESYDSMISESSYKKRLSKEEAIEELKREKAKQFDPNIIEVFLKIL